MNWSQQIDIYCERTEFTFWAEPLNALTNGFYLLGAVLMFLRLRRDGLPLGLALCALLAAISVGSFLFHTQATALTALADTAPIALFILTYLYAVNREVLGWRRRAAVALTLAYIPYAAALMPLLGRVPFLAISDAYWTVPVALVFYAPLVARHNRRTGLGFLLGAGLLSLSITVRSLDLTLCGIWPLGTHFLWHCLNALLLPLMIEVYRRDRLEARKAQG